MSDNVERDRYIRRIVKEDSCRLFGALLRLVMLRVGINQEQLAQDSRAYLDMLERRGSIDPGERVEIGQSTISDAVKGKREKLSPSQLTVWFEVLKIAYVNPDYVDYCKQHGIEKHDFPEDLQIDMHRLAKCGTVKEMVAAFERRKNMVRYLPHKWRNGIDPDSPAGPSRNDLPPQYNASVYRAHAPMYL